MYTVQITFIFIDFRVCNFAFAFKTQNAPYVSRFKRVLFSDRFQFAFSTQTRRAFDLSPRLMHLTSHITHSNGYAPYIAYYRSNGLDQRFRKLKPKPKLNPPNAHRSQIKICENRQSKMCSFRSCQTRFEFLSQFRKVWNAFECFVTQVQTRLPKTKCVWPMKINVICTVYVIIGTDFCCNRVFIIRGLRIFSQVNINRSGGKVPLYPVGYIGYWL